MTETVTEQAPREIGVVHTTSNGREYILSSCDCPRRVRKVITNRASVEHTLEFANELRTAGGGDTIEYLIPSMRNEQNACLIANALNFDSCVLGDLVLWKNGENTATGQKTPNPDNDMFLDTYLVYYRPDWVMWFEENIAKSVSEKMGLDLVYGAGDNYGGYCWGVELPEGIGNVAAAFDTGCDLELIKFDLDKQEVDSE